MPLSPANVKWRASVFMNSRPNRAIITKRETELPKNRDSLAAVPFSFLPRLREHAPDTPMVFYPAVSSAIFASILPASSASAKTCGVGRQAPFKIGRQMFQPEPVI